MTLAAGQAIRIPSPRGLVIRQAKPSIAFYGGWLVGRARGSALCEIPTSTAPNPALMIEGVVDYIESPPFTSSATTDSGGGAVDPITLQPQDIRIVPAPTGWFDTGTSTHQIKAQHIGLRCYAFDNNTLYLDDLNGQLPYAGIVDDVKAGATTTAAVRLRFDPRPDGVPTTGEVDTARAVATSIGAYTGTTTGALTVTATGALGAQDGVTLAPGDVVFIPEGLTNITADTDAGPYEVINAGGTGVSAVLRRPWWYATGSAIGLSRKISIGGEGTLWAGVTWRSDAAKGAAVDTTAPAFWETKVSKAVTLASGTIVVTGLPIKSATGSPILVSPSPTTAPNTATRTWRCSAATAGKVNTGAGDTQASMTIVAETAPGTTNASDAGTYVVTVEN